GARSRERGSRDASLRSTSFLSTTLRTRGGSPRRERTPSHKGGRRVLTHRVFFVSLGTSLLFWSAACEQTVTTIVDADAGTDGPTSVDDTSGSDASVRAPDGGGKPTTASDGGGGKEAGALDSGSHDGSHPPNDAGHHDASSGSPTTTCTQAEQCGSGGVTYQ